MISSVEGNPIKCLEKGFNNFLKDKDSVEDTTKRLQTRLKLVKGSGLPGKYKFRIPSSYESGDIEGNMTKSCRSFKSISIKTPNPSP